MVRSPEGRLGRLGVPKEKPQTPLDVKEVKYYEPGEFGKPQPKFETKGTVEYEYEAAQKRKIASRDTRDTTILARETGEIPVEPIPRGLSRKGTGLKYTKDEFPTAGENRNRVDQRIHDPKDPYGTSKERERRSELSAEARRQAAYERAQQREVEAIMAEHVARAQELKPQFEKRKRELEQEAALEDAPTEEMPMSGDIEEGGEAQVA